MTAATFKNLMVQYNIPQSAVAGVAQIDAAAVSNFLAGRVVTDYIRIKTQRAIFSIVNFLVYAQTRFGIRPDVRNLDTLNRGIAMLEKKAGAALHTQVLDENLWKMDGMPTKEKLLNMLLAGFALVGRVLTPEEKRELESIVDVEAAGIVNWGLEGLAVSKSSPEKI